jgi:ribosomal protein S17
MAETQEVTSHDSRRRKLEGVITSDKMMKTVVVLVTTACAPSSTRST